MLEVDFVNTPLADIINDIGNALNIDVFTATPLDQAGMATFKAKSISFDALLTTIFEGQTTQTSETSELLTSNNSNFNNQNQRASCKCKKLQRLQTLYLQERRHYLFLWNRKPVECS